MRIILTIFLLTSGLFAFSTATYYNHNYYYEGKPCSYGYTNYCGTKELLSEDIYPVDDTSAPNVCKTVRIYRRYKYNCYYTKQCHYSYWWKYQCHWKCSCSDTCDEPTNVTSVEYHCCEGFTTALAKTDGGNYYSYIEPHSEWKIRSEGCPIEIKENIVDCLEELDLTELQCILEGTNLETTLEGDGMFTLFAPTNEVLQDSGLGDLSMEITEFVLGSHVVEKKLESLLFYDGQRLESINEDCFIHVTEIDKYKYVWHYYSYYKKRDGDEIFISGAKIIGRDACIARNGIVHIVDRVVECGNQTIADIVQEEDEYSILEFLLSTADLLEFLDKPTPALTLFAPTNQAFMNASEDLDLDIVECLSNETNLEELKKFLLFHIVCGAEFSSSLIMRNCLVTKVCHRVIKYYHYYYYKWYTECLKLNVEITDEGIVVGDDDVLITTLDIVASNGVIHEVSLPLLNPKIDLAELCASFPRDGFTVLVNPPPFVPPPERM